MSRTDDGWVELPVTVAETETALRRAVDEWGGGFSEDGSSELAVPVRAGLRHGYARLRPVIEETSTGSRLRLERRDQELVLDRAATAVLALGAVGGIITVLWPLHGSLQALAPIGALLALVAWLMVASRFRSQGPEELLETVVELAGEDVEEDSGAEC